MTTRVVAVRAATILRLSALELADDHDEVQWMSALRSVSALQMYQRATRGPIHGVSVVRFLLFYSPFPRSVQACLDGLRTEISCLPDPDSVLAALDAAERVLVSCDPAADDGPGLERAMDELQDALGAIGDAVTRRYLAVSNGPGTSGSADGMMSVES